MSVGWEDYEPVRPLKQYTPINHRVCGGWRVSSAYIIASRRAKADFRPPGWISPRRYSPSRGTNEKVGQTP